MAEFTHKVDFSTLDPAQKLHILKEMGFREDGPLEHTINCTSRQGSGLRCTCLPGTTSFKAPADVKKYMGETTEARQAFGELREAYFNDGEGENPGSWVDYLTRTAPRYQR
jgi:hypothetical protein